MKVIDMKDTTETAKIAVVVSRFNGEITEELLKGCLSRLKEKGVSDKDILVAWVPGAVEIPLAVQRIAELSVYDAIIALGAVIRGETTHYDSVCEQASQGCQHVALQHAVPVLFGVLTTENEEQAKDRIGGRHGHKGKDAADAALEMAACLKAIE